MAKQGPMDNFLARKRPSSGNSREYIDHRIDIDPEDNGDSESDDGGSSEISKVSGNVKSRSKKSRTSFFRKYDASYIRFEFMSNSEDKITEKPQCVICGDVL